MRNCQRSPLKICAIVVSILAVGTLLFSLQFEMFNLTKHNSLAGVVYKYVMQRSNALIVYPLDVKEPDSPEIPCATQKTKYSGSTPICVYNATVDTIVSNAILKNGAWEPHLTGLMEELFRRDPHLNLLDFGSNIGAFTVTALKSGRKVVAVDPKAGNLRRIRMSIHKGNLTGAVLVQNGLSDFRTTATFHQHHSNNGGLYLTDSNLNLTYGYNAAVKFQVRTILVTDLIPLIKFKRAMIKIDIQGFEYKAFRNLDALLKVLDIPFIQMEWVMVKLGETGNRMVALMYKLGYQCFQSVLNGAPCPGNDHTKWPYDVVWVRTDATVYPGAYEAIRIWNGKPPVTHITTASPINGVAIVYPLNIKEPDSPEIPCTARKTKYSGVTAICVYKATVDTVVSKAILINGAWEPHLTELMEELFRRNPNLNLLDFGSNVGAFTVTALKSGRKVVAVDPKAENLRRIRMSIHKGNLTGAVLVQNGLSDFRTTATFHQDPGNNGGSYLTDTKLNNTHGIIAKVKFQVKTILVTDLIPVIRFKRAMIKIDIQGFELKAFQHLESFLKTVDIPFILMEWIWVKVGETGKRMVALMYKLGYQCFQTALNGARCPGNDHTKWSYDVVWVRTNATVYPGAYEAIRIWNGKPKPS